MRPWGPEEHGESISVRGGEPAGRMDFPSVPVSLACPPNVLTSSGGRLLFSDRPCSLRKEGLEVPAGPAPLDRSSRPRPQPPCSTERLSLSLLDVRGRVAPCTPGPQPCLRRLKGLLCPEVSSVRGPRNGSQTPGRAAPGSRWLGRGKDSRASQPGRQPGGHGFCVVLRAQSPQGDATWARRHRTRVCYRRGAGIRDRKSTRLNSSH